MSRFSLQKLPGTCYVAGLLFFSISFLSADLIDLNRPVGDSLSTITGIYISADTTEASGPDTLTPDLSPNGYDMKFIQGTGAALPSLTPGVNKPGASGFGNGIRLNTTQTTSGDPGNPHLHVTMPVTNNMGMVDVSFTGGAWLNFNSVQSTSQYIIIMDRGGFNLPTSAGSTGANYGHWGLALQKSSTGLWRMEFNMGDGFGTSRIFNSTTYNNWDIQLQEWNHFGFTYTFDPDGDNTVNFYLNGVNVGTVTTSRNITAGANYTPNRTFTIGDRTVSTRTSLFDGSVDDIFATQGIHTFVHLIPEPAAALLLTIAGTFCAVRKRRRV